MTKIKKESETPKKKGRKPGVKKMKENAFIDVIPNKFRIDISDEKNYIVQEYKYKTIVEDDEEKNVQQWMDVDAPFHSNVYNAFKKIRNLLIINKIKSKGKITIDEFLQLYKDNDEKLFNLFSSKFKED